MGELLAPLIEHGVLVVFVATLAARIGAPVPAAPVLVVAGGLAVGGQLSLLATFVASIVANVIGDAVWFVAGRRHGYRVMKLLCRISLSPDSCVRQSEELIARWGGSSLVAAKFIPGVSVIAAPMTGALGMSRLRFLGFAVLAAAIWSALYVALGMVFSDQIQQVLDVMAGTGAIATAIVVLLLAAVVALRWWRRRRVQREMTMARIGVDALREAMGSERAPLVIDVRSAASVAIDGRRIPGAISIHLDEVAAKAPALPRDRDIVVYCNCPNEVSAAQAALLLAAHGLGNARPLAGGLDAWVAAGGSVEEVRAASEVGAAGRVVS